MYRTRKRLGRECDTLRTVQNFEIQTDHLIPKEGLDRVRVNNNNNNNKRKKENSGFCHPGWVAD